MSLPTVLDLTALRSLYAQRRITLHDLVDALSARMDDADPAVFITRATLAGMRAQADALVARAPAPNSLPLWGMPFAVKDNIDVVGFPTTAGCPAFAHDAAADAEVVARLRAAGAIMIGKTNLDQFATRSEEHTSELQSLMRISYAVFCLKKKKKQTQVLTIKHLTQNQKHLRQIVITS